MNKPIPKGKQIDGDMTAALDSRFLNAIVLKGALEKAKKPTLPVTIDRIEYHDVLKYENGKTDKDAYLLYFVGSDKPLKLAKTNVKRLIDQCGVMGEGWHGKKIELCLEQEYRPDIRAKGDCVRVKIQHKSGF